MGEASCVWLHKSLVSLNESLNNNWFLYNQDSLKVILKLCLEYNIKKKLSEIVVISHGR